MRFRFIWAVGLLMNCGQIVNGDELETLRSARAASIETTAALFTAEAAGTFTVHRRDENEKEETIWRDADVKLWNSHGKQCLDITNRHRKMPYTRNRQDECSTD